MKKVIALFTPLIFSFFSNAQSVLSPASGKNIELCDTNKITIIRFDTCITVNACVTPNGYAGTTWFQIEGDTTKWGKKTFDWRDGTANGTMLVFCSIHPLRCGQSYTLKFVAEGKNKPAKSVLKNFETNKCQKKILTPKEKKQIEKEKKKQEKEEWKKKKN